MSTLDSFNDTPTSKPIWNTVLQYGAINGAISIGISLLGYIADVNLFGFTTLLVFIAIGFVMAYLAMKHQRDQLDGGIISYGKALSIGILVILLATVINSLWNLVLLNFIDPDYLNKMGEYMQQSMGNWMPEEAMEQALADLEKQKQIGPSMLNALIGGTFSGLIIGLIMAAFVKREPRRDYMR
jgi:Protein of unknown function (DUF4199)